MTKFKYVKSFHEDENHIHDNYTNEGYEYHRNLLNKVVSLEMFANKLNDIPYRLIERLIEYLIDTVKLIKLLYAIAFPKNSNKIN